MKLSLLGADSYTGCHYTYDLYHGCCLSYINCYCSTHPYGNICPEGKHHFIIWNYLTMIGLFTFSHLIYIQWQLHVTFRPYEVPYTMSIVLLAMEEQLGYIYRVVQGK